MRRNGRYFIGGLVHPTRGEPLEGVQIGDELHRHRRAECAREQARARFWPRCGRRPGQSRTLTLSGAGGERKMEAPALDLS